MIFDPFDDFKERGYLRNKAALHEPEAVKEFEHRNFLSKLDLSLNKLSRLARISYQDVLDTHKTLFEDVYPWAGQDRTLTLPDRAVSKGSVLFAHPDDAKIAVDHALRIGQDAALMADKPGEVMGYLAYGHPFLDGNGRTIMVVHTELAERAGISIDWAATDKTEYLTALTRELKKPDKGHLDSYLKPFIGQAIGRDRLASHVARTSGLDGNAGQSLDATKIAGALNDPVLQARYQHQQQERRGKDGSAAGEPERVPNLEEDLRSAEARAAQDPNERGRPRGGGRGR
jgi:cell filamentation protein